MKEDDEEYYRIYLDSTDAICIVCMQWFDEHDYNQARFLSEQKFTDEEEAHVFLRTMQNSNRSFPRVIADALANYKDDDDFMNIFDKE